MPVQYHIYGNGGSGGPIDWTTPIATVSGISWTSPVLAANSQWRFGVRAFDTVSGLEESSVDAVVSVNLDAAQSDITARPPAPEAVTALPRANGGYRVEWHWPTPFLPNGFHVYLGTPTPNYAVPVATVLPTGRLSYRYDGTGLTDGVTYQVAVRAYNTSGEETNVNVASVIGAVTPPANVDSLTVTATTQS